MKFPEIGVVVRHQHRIELSSIFYGLLPLLGCINSVRAGCIRMDWW